MSKLFKSAVLCVFVTFVISGIAAAETRTAAAKAGFARHDFPFKSRYVEVLGSKMHYVDTGGPGSTIVMIHGQPTWSYLWRNIIPHLKDRHRVIALDLIGFGKSDKPDIEYLVTQHAKYLQGFMDALKLKDITLVVHDWGSVLGFDFAARNPSRVKAIAFMEAVVFTGPAQPPYGPVKAKLRSQPVRNMAWFAKILQRIKTPGVGEKMILQDNFFLEKLVLPSFANLLTEDEKNAYREPFPALTARTISILSWGTKGRRVSQVFSKSSSRAFSIA